MEVRLMSIDLGFFSNDGDRPSLNLRDSTLVLLDGILTAVVGGSGKVNRSGCPRSRLESCLRWTSMVAEIL